VRKHLHLVLGTVLAIGLATAALPPLPNSTVVASAASSSWYGEYYSNPWLSGAPAVTRDDASICFDWGAGAPAPGIPADDFSVRWTATEYFEGGLYRFTTQTDDGVRLYVDGELLIDQWREQAVTTYHATRQLAAGNHSVRMEFYERGGSAVARLWWERIESPTPSQAWLAAYYPNKSFSGSATIVRYEGQIDYDWGVGSPGSGIPTDGFSVRWAGYFFLEAGRYKFTTETDDGVRLYVDGNLVIDEWHDMGRTPHSVELELASGVHPVRMDYYENLGDAFARLTWVRVPEKELPRGGNIITCVRPRPHNSWIKIYRLEDDGWLDINPHGWGPVSASGFLKIDGLPVDIYRYAAEGHPYRVELWADGSLICSVGNTDRGEPDFRVWPGTDSYTPWGCPAP